MAKHTYSVCLLLLAFEIAVVTSSYDRRSESGPAPKEHHEVHQKHLDRVLEVQRQHRQRIQEKLKDKKHHFGSLSYGGYSHFNNEKPDYADGGTGNQEDYKPKKVHFKHGGYYRISGAYEDHDGDKNKMANPDKSDTKSRDDHIDPIFGLQNVNNGGYATSSQENALHGDKNYPGRVLSNNDESGNENSDDDDGEVVNDDDDDFVVSTTTTSQVEVKNTTEDGNVSGNVEQGDNNNNKNNNNNNNNSRDSMTSGINKENSVFIESFLTTAIPENVTSESMQTETQDGRNDTVSGVKVELDRIIIPHEEQPFTTEVTNSNNVNLSNKNNTKEHDNAPTSSNVEHDISADLIPNKESDVHNHNKNCTGNMKNSMGKSLTTALPQDSNTTPKNLTNNERNSTIPQSTNMITNSTDKPNEDVFVSDKLNNSSKAGKTSDGIVLDVIKNNLENKTSDDFFAETTTEINSFNNFDFETTMESNNFDDFKFETTNEPNMFNNFETSNEPNMFNNFETTNEPNMFNNFDFETTSHGIEFEDFNNFETTTETGFLDQNLGDDDSTLPPPFIGELDDFGSTSSPPVVDLERLDELEENGDLDSDPITHVRLGKNNYLVIPPVGSKLDEFKRLSPNELQNLVNFLLHLQNKHYGKVDYESE